jgi:hypothetical protein
MCFSRSSVTFWVTECFTPSYAFACGYLQSHYLLATGQRPTFDNLWEPPLFAYSDFSPLAKVHNPYYACFTPAGCPPQIRLGPERTLRLLPPSSDGFQPSAIVWVDPFGRQLSTCLWLPHDSYLCHTILCYAVLTGFEPATFSLTGKRALHTAPQDHVCFLY